MISQSREYAWMKSADNKTEEHVLTALLKEFMMMIMENNHWLEMLIK